MLSVKPGGDVFPVFCQRNRVGVDLKTTVGVVLKVRSRMKIQVRMQEALSTRSKSRNGARTAIYQNPQNMGDRGETRLHPLSPRQATRSFHFLYRTGAP